MKNLIVAIILFSLCLLLHGCKLESVHPATLRVEFNSSIDCYTVSFSSTSSDEQNWDFGDGASSTETNPTHTYEAAGQYEVKLSVLSEIATGELTNTITVDPQATTFSEEAPNKSGKRIFPRALAGGYHIIGSEGNSGFSSVLDFSSRGVFEGVSIATGSASRNFVAYFNPQNQRNIAIYNNGNDNTVWWDYSDPLSGVGIAQLSLPDTSLFAMDAKLNEAGTTFTIGVYDTNPSTIASEGIFVWTVGTGVWSKFIIELPDPRTVSIDVTADGGAIVAAIVPNQGIYILKIDASGQQVWGRYLTNSRFRISNAREPSLSIVSLANDEYAVSTAEYNDISGIPTDNADAKGYVIRANNTTEIWRTTIDGATHLNKIISTKDNKLMACGGFNDKAIIVPYLVSLNQTGEIQFAKEVSGAQERNILLDMLETAEGEFLLLGNSLLGNSARIRLLQVDCGGNL